MLQKCFGKRQQFLLQKNKYPEGAEELGVSLYHISLYIWIQISRLEVRVCADIEGILQGDVLVILWQCPPGWQE